jgi:hypothetical protein
MGWSMAMRRKMRAVALAVVTLLFCGGGAPPVIEGDGFGGRLALTAARTATTAEPDSRSHAEYDLRHAGVAPYDADRDGVLSFAEWVERALAPYLIDDTDGDGRLSLREHRQTATRRPTLSPAVVASIFRELDSDRDGYVSVRDLARREAAQFRGLDRNRDGALSDEEIGTTMPVVSQPQAAVADLIGMMPNQLRERFGLEPDDRDFVRMARLEGATLVTLIDIGLAGRGACTNDGGGWLEDARSRDRPQFEFRGGRLADVLVGARSNQSRVVSVALRCVQKTGGHYVDPVTFMIAAPFLPAIAVQKARYQTRSREAAAVIADLRLGQPPPGGIAAYAASPPAQVTVVPGGEGAAEIVIKVEETNFEAKVNVRDGVVNSIVPPPFKSCVFGDDYAFHC